MISDQRVLHGTTDISVKVNDYRAGAHTFAYTTGQYLYIGSVLPFNNLWFEMGTLNIVPATATVEIWWGNAWTAAVDVIDETVGLTANGRIQWSTEYTKGWDMELRSADVTGLSTTNIYNMFWLRLSWSANLTAGTTLKYIGQKFANDDILYSFYPDLNNATILTSFEAGKTTWDEQHYMAAEHIVRDLKKRDIVKARAQMMDYSLFEDASAHKVAEIIYQSFGKPYFEQLGLAKKEYEKAINLKYFNVDKTMDGRLDPIDREFEVGFGTR